VDWFISGVSNIVVATWPVLLFSFDPLENHPERVDVTRYVATESQKHVNEEVAGAASQEADGRRREEDRDQAEENVRAADHVG